MNDIYVILDDDLDGSATGSIAITNSKSEGSGAGKARCRCARFDEGVCPTCWETHRAKKRKYPPKDCETN